MAVKSMKSSSIYQNHFSHHAVNINFGTDSVLVPVLSGNLRNCSFLCWDQTIFGGCCLVITVMVAGVFVFVCNIMIEQELSV